MFDYTIAGAGVVLGAVASFLISKYFFNLGNKKKQLILDAFEMFSLGDEVAFRSIVDKLKLKDDDAPLIRFMMGITYFNEGLLRQSINEFEKMLFKSPANFQANFHLGLIYQNIRPAFAYKYYEDALKKNPRNFNLLLNYALLVHNSVLFRSGDETRKQQAVKLSIAYYLKALEIIPDHENAKLNLVLALKASSEFKGRRIQNRVKNLELKKDTIELYNELFKETMIRPYSELENM